MSTPLANDSAALRRRVRSLGQALAVVVVALGALAVVPSAAGRLDGTIAYGIHGSGSVYLVRPDGTESRKVLRDAQWVELSRDARRLAYARSWGNKGLWTADTDGAARRRVVNPASREIEGQLHYQTREPSWSPDSKRIAFAAVWAPDEENFRSRSEERIVTVKSTGGGLRVLADGAAPAWSPRGNLIAYTTDVGGTGSDDDWNRVAVMRPDGTGRRIVVGDRTAWRTGLDFSPTGRSLLYTDRDFKGDRDRLVVLNLKTGRRTTVTTQPGHFAVWAPSGRWIAYLRYVAAPPDERTPPNDVRMMRPDGTSDRLLFSLPFDQEEGQWADVLSWRPNR